MTGKVPLVYFGHGLTGYYGIQRLMRGDLKDKVEVKKVIVSYKDKDKADLVKNIASMYGLEVCTEPVSSDELADKIKECGAELGVVMNFDQKIPQKIIDAIPSGIWNVHPSDLPRWRGGVPLEYLIVNGDDFRVSVHTMTEKFDDGEIVYKSYPIKIWDMDIDELYFLSSKQSALALEEALDLYTKGTYSKTPQDTSKATYARASELDKLLKIDWGTDGGETIMRKVLAGGVNRGAISGISIEGQDKQFRITEANFIPEARQTEMEYGKVYPMFDGSYAVCVNGGTLYISGIKGDTSQNDSQTNSQIDSQIIHTLNRANNQKVLLT